MRSPAVAAFTKTFPRGCSVLGTEKYPSILIVMSKIGTIGSIVFETALGNEAYLYPTGVSPMQMRFGGVTEVTTNPTGGKTIFQATATPVVFDPQRLPPGFLVYGSPRVKSDVIITPTPGYAPALGIMLTDYGYSSIIYMYVLDDGTNMSLTLGSEDMWLTQNTGNVLAFIEPSGAQGRYLEGRTVLVDTPLQRAANLNPPNCVVIQSGGPTAALGIVNSAPCTTQAQLWNMVMAYHYAGGSMVANSLPGWCTLAGV